ncbi:MAG: translation initiation factor eIF-2B subunit alpha [Tremellales sp. Tagirdzhanova-0007]|nr:MAG: translation initiation factor eIF-2B subunit alpha [Tremellales sp. Tagirdzhanova-0007]
MALVELMEASTSSTVTGLATELTLARQLLVDTQTSLGVRAGCQLWERFFALSGGGEKEFPSYKRSLIAQGRAFCATTAPQCRIKIAALAVDFLRDDCTVLTHNYSRTVIQTILRAHKQHKRVKVYVTEARPSCLGMRTHEILTDAGIPCTVVLDSAVAYVMDRVDMVLVGTEAVVESGGLVSSTGTYQVALIAKAMQKPFYALAESYKFLRHYPLSQTDLPIPRLASSSVELPLSFPLAVPHPPPIPTSKPASAPVRGEDQDSPEIANTVNKIRLGRLEVTKAMEKLNPLVDVTTPDLIDFIITDLGAPLSPTSVSQYLVAQFSS